MKHIEKYDVGHVVLLNTSIHPKSNNIRLNLFLSLINNCRFDVPEYKVTQIVYFYSSHLVVYTHTM